MKRLRVACCLLLVSGSFPPFEGGRGMWFSYKLLVYRFWFGIHYSKPLFPLYPLFPFSLTSKI